mgnify:CR=1 FL=1
MTDSMETAGYVICTECGVTFDWNVPHFCEKHYGEIPYRFEHVVDSGKREEFKTGSIRDTRIGKGRFDLIAPYSLTRLAQHYENGAVKYGDRNWERGQNLSRYLDSAIRHLVKYLGGSREEDHLSAVAWNVFSYIQTEQWVKEGKLPQELNDIDYKNPVNSMKCSCDFTTASAIEWVCHKRDNPSHTHFMPKETL